MQHLQARKIWLKIKDNLPFIIVVVLALILRLYLLPKHTLFDADQEEIALKAKEIINGDFVLLGQKTSLGGFSIGPGFIYLWSIVGLFLHGNPLSGAYLSVFLGVAFIFLIYYIFTKTFSKLCGAIVSLVLCISISMINWDQLPWAPSLFYISELVIFYGVYISNKNTWGLPVVALGFAIGFQSHFAIFLLLLPVVVYWLLYRPLIKKKMVHISISTIVLGISTVIVFDITHNFANFQRLLSIFSLGIRGVGLSATKLFNTLISNSVNILWPDFPNIIKYIIFASLIVFVLIMALRDRKMRNLIILSLLFMFIPFATFVIYRSNFSEYYLMTAVVPFLFILGYIFSHAKNIVIIPVLIILTFLNLKSFYHNERVMNLYAKEQVVKAIIEKGGIGGYGVSLSTQLGYSFGYRYLFDYYGARPDIPPLKDQQKIFTIIVPPGFEGIEALYEVDGIGLRWEGI